MSDRYDGGSGTETEGVSTVFGDIEYVDDPPESLRIVVEGALEDAGFDGIGLHTWVPSGEFESSSLVRLPRFPNSIDGEERHDLSLAGVRNEQQSSQLAITTAERVAELTCSVGELVGDAGRIPAENVRSRFVGYVPVERTLSESTWSATLEGVAGDAVSGSRRPDVGGGPLLERTIVDVPPYQTQPIWFTVDIPETAEPGEYVGTISVDAADRDPIEFELAVTAQTPVLPPTFDFDFHFDAWMCPDRIAQEYDVELWSESHWSLLEASFECLGSRSQSAVTTTLVEDPWIVDWLEDTRRSTTESGYSSMVRWEYNGESWSFDFSVFDRYVEMGKGCDIGPRVHAFGLLGFRPRERLYCFHTNDGGWIEESVDVGDDRWTDAWTAFFDDFVGHLEERGWLEKTWLAIDERDEEILEETVSFLDDVAPSSVDRLSIAGSDDAAPYADDLSLDTIWVPSVPPEYEKSHIDETDIGGGFHADPVPPETVTERRRRGRRRRSTPPERRHPNRLAFSPAVESRLLPRVAADNGYDGFLYWSYCSWPEHVYTNPTFQYVQGDEYLVYPGQEGPISSIRWELLREGIEEYELIRETGDEAFFGSDVRVEEALSIATAELDGRAMDVTAVPRARSLLVKALADRR